MFSSPIDSLRRSIGLYFHSEESGSRRNDKKGSCKPPNFEYKYELHIYGSDCLGNVRVTISDLKIGNGTPIYSADIRSYTNHYAFGMVQPDRSWVAGGGYRYGFNGKESDNEISGNGNQYDYGFRIYNPRIARFLSEDPLTKDYPSWSPYPFAMNRPIDGIDLDGLEWQHFSPAHEQQGGDFGSSGPVYNPIEAASNAGSKARREPSIKEQLASGMAIYLSPGSPETQQEIYYPLFKAILPDAFQIGFGLSAVFPMVGPQANVELTFILDGPESSLDPHLSATVGIGAGIDISGGLYIGGSWCSAPFEQVTAQSIGGTNIDLSGGFFLSGGFDQPPIEKDGQEVGRWYQLNLGRPGLSLFSASVSKTWITDEGIVEGTTNFVEKVANEAYNGAQTMYQDFFTQTGLPMPSGTVIP